MSARFTTPQVFIRIHKNNESRAQALNLVYTEIPDKFEDVVEWADKPPSTDESGDLNNIMEISAKTIFSLAECLQTDGTSQEREPNRR